MSGIVGSRFNIRGSGLVGSLGTDGQVFTSSGAGAGAVFEAGAAGGDLIRIASEETDSATSDFTFDGCWDGTTYVHYRIVGFLAPTSSSNLQMQWRVGGAGSRSTLTTSEYVYLKSGRSINSSASQADSHGGSYDDSQWVIAENVRTDSNSSLASFDLMISDPDTTVMSRAFAAGTVAWHHVTSNQLNTTVFAGRNSSNVNATGIKIFFSSGNIGYGWVNIYGYNKD